MAHLLDQKLNTSVLKQFWGEICMASDIAISVDCLTTDETFLLYGGKRDTMINRLEKEYGMTKEEAEFCMNSLG